MLSVTIPVNIRFSEIDSLRIVWHGNYLKYFEDGREAFGKKFGIGYLDVFEIGLITPVVHVSCDYKKPIEYNDPVMIETTFINTDAAKIIFSFKLFNKDNQQIYAMGESIQVFLNEDKNLQLVPPQFFISWKKKWGLL